MLLNITKCNEVREHFPFRENIYSPENVKIQFLQTPSGFKLDYSVILNIEPKTLTKDMIRTNITIRLSICYVKRYNQSSFCARHKIFFHNTQSLSENE